MKLSIQIAAIRRKIRRLEDHRPLMLQRLQGMSEPDRAVMIQWLDDIMAKAKIALENMEQELLNPSKPV
jgi:hypothetical protein